MLQDIDTVDNGIEKNLFSLMQNVPNNVPGNVPHAENSDQNVPKNEFEWDFFVAHFLGLVNVLIVT